MHALLGLRASSYHTGQFPKLTCTTRATLHRGPLGHDSREQKEGLFISKPAAAGEPAIQASCKWKIHDRMNSNDACCKIPAASRRASHEQLKFTVAGL